MNSYYSISNVDIENLLNFMKNNKNKFYDGFYQSLNYQFNKNKNQNAKYRLAAKSLLSKIDNKSYLADELMVDDDALVSENDNGAYVQCWVWVENDTKRKTRKNSK